MKRSRVIHLFLCATLLQISLSYAQRKDGLVAAPYPGSVAEPVEKSSPNAQTFYSKDSFEKVKAHYTKTLGPVDHNRIQAENVEFCEAIPSNDVMDILAKRGIEMGETRAYAGVTFHGKTLNSNYTYSKVIDKLKYAYVLRFKDEDPPNPAKHMEDPELKKVVARYEHIAHEHFPKKNGKGMDEILFDKHYTAPEAETAQEQKGLVAKMTELMTQQKFDDAQKVSDRMMVLSQRPSDAKWNWDIAIKCLDELERNAYATKIVIDKHPSLWDFSSAK